MKQGKRILPRLIRPGGLWPIPLAVLGVSLLSFVFGAGLQDTVFGAISYPISLYGLVVLGLGFPGIISHTKALISRNKYGAVYLSDNRLRARISLYQGLVVNVGFVVFYAYTSLRYGSGWFGAVAVYYSILGGMRFVLLRSVRRTARREDAQERRMYELRSYRFCGVLMFLLNMGMAGMIVQMIWQNKGYHYSGLIIYASASYAFYCLITAIINMVRFGKMESPVLSAAKMLSFAGALMSMLAMQTAMIAQFGADDTAFRQLMNTLIGGSVFVTVLCMAIFMVLRGNRELKKLRFHNIQTKQDQI